MLPEPKGRLRYENIVVVSDKGLTINITHNISKTAKDTPKRFNWRRFSWHWNDDDPWISIEDVIKIHSHQVTKAWDPELISTEYWMSEHHEGGGLAGVEDEYFITRKNLINMGKRLIKEQEIESELDKKHRRGRAR